jgi:hypothetical protein
MYRKRTTRTSTNNGGAFDDFHDWVLSLPWVVERPYSLGTPGVRAFGVDCEPLGRRQLWLVTGLQAEMESDGFGLALIVPEEAAHEIEAARCGRSVAPMPARHAMVTVYGDLDRSQIESLVLSAYGYAMS